VNFHFLRRAAAGIFLSGLMFCPQWAARADCILEPMMQGQDPQVEYQAGYFNLVQSDGCNIWLRKSATLGGLATPVMNQIILSPGCSNLWAPEIHWFDNRWYLYYSLGSPDHPNHRVYVAQSQGTAATGPYTIKGVLFNDYWNIDGSVFVAANGQYYFVFSGSPSGSQQNIYIAPLSNPYTLSGSPVMISAPTQSWEKNGMPPSVNEGPFGFVHEGRMFIVYSASGCWTDDYCLGLLTLTGSDPLNPAAWTKSGPVFSRQPSAYGPGHNCVVVDGSGQWWNVYHANNLSGQGCGGYRQLHAQRLFWNADGSPYFGAPVPTNSLVVADTNWLAAQYPLTATSGTNVATTTCGAAGVFVGAPVWQNPGLKFNGVSDYVDGGAQLGNDVQSALTLAAWIKADAFIDWAGIVTKGINVSPYALQTWHDGSVRFTANWGSPGGGVGGGSWNSDAKLATNQWYHVAVTYDGVNIRFYTNGILDSVQPAAGMHFGVVNESMTIGADLPGGDEYFAGTIRDVRVYGRALSAAEINLITGINHAPVLAPVPDQQTRAGQTLLVTNIATDTEAPPQLLLFTLLNRPDGAGIGTLNGVFSWRPSVSQADSTNLVTVRVADTGTPSLTATQSFYVTVGKLNLPVINAPAWSNGFFQMTVTGDDGPDYQIWRSTNLADWELLQQFNAPALPFNWTNPAATKDSARFYRIQLSP
jgi:GH43 family beta-xylosidase